MITKTNMLNIHASSLKTQGSKLITIKDIVVICITLQIVFPFVGKIPCSAMRDIFPPSAGTNGSKLKIAIPMLITNSHIASKLIQLNIPSSHGRPSAFPAGISSCSNPDIPTNPRLLFSGCCVAVNSKLPLSVSSFTTSPGFMFFVVFTNCVALIVSWSFSLSSLNGTSRFAL